MSVMPILLSGSSALSCYLPSDADSPSTFTFFAIYRVQWRHANVSLWSSKQAIHPPAVIRRCYRPSKITCLGIVYIYISHFVVKWQIHCAVLKIMLCHCRSSFQFQTVEWIIYDTFQLESKDKGRAYISPAKRQNNHFLHLYFRWHLMCLTSWRKFLMFSWTIINNQLMVERHAVSSLSSICVRFRSVT